MEWASARATSGRGIGQNSYVYTVKRFMQRVLIDGTITGIIRQITTYGGNE